MAGLSEFDERQSFSTNAGRPPRCFHFEFTCIEAMHWAVLRYVLGENPVLTAFVA